MTIRFAERPDSRSTTWTERTGTLEYFCTGTTDAEMVQQIALLNSPPMWGGLYRQDITITAQASDYFLVSVPYGPRPIGLGEMYLEFDSTGGTIHVTASRQTVGAYGAGAAVDDFKGMIGVHEDQIDGADVVIPALKLTVRFQHPAGVVTLPRIKALARATGKVNSDQFLTFAPGEVLFLGATGQESNVAATNVAYHYACSENATLTIGQIANIVKAGHNYVWITYKRGMAGGKPVLQPDRAYVERLYETTSFVSLFGFGA